MTDRTIDRVRWWCTSNLCHYLNGVVSPLGLRWGATQGTELAAFAVWAAAIENHKRAPNNHHSMVSSYSFSFRVILIVAVAYKRPRDIKDKWEYRTRNEICEGSSRIFVLNGAPTSSGRIVMMWWTCSYWAFNVCYLRIWSKRRYRRKTENHRWLGHNRI